MKTMHRFYRFSLLIALSVCIVFVFAACMSDTVAQVKITADGKVFLNGEETTIDQLREEFVRLKAVDGTVEYYRENPEQDPHPIFEQVLTAIVEADLPIRFSETDFE